MSKMLDINKVMNAKTVEPRRRLCGGSMGWVVHRFPIKGGISLHDAWLMDFNQTNLLLKRLLERDKNAEN